MAGIIREYKDKTYSIEHMHREALIALYKAIAYMPLTPLQTEMIKQIRADIINTIGATDLITIPERNTLATFEGDSPL